MQTVITDRGQISIPASLRRKFRLEPGTGVEWIDTPDGIYLLPVPKDPIKAFRGQSRGLTNKLMDARREERLKDR